MGNVFQRKTNADAWSLYSYDDQLVAPPLVGWSGPRRQIRTPSLFFLGGEAVWFFADGLTAQGALVGNYAEQKISGIDVSVNVDPAEINFVDLAVFADGPVGLDYYYSLIYQPDDLGEMPDW